MKIGFIGMGTMGAPMALNVLKAGHEVTVHNRTRNKEEAVAAEGASRAATPKEGAEGADVVITNVSDTPDVEAVVLGENGAIHSMKEGSVLIDVSTISPIATKQIAENLSAKGVSMLDAPVSGGSEGAEKGTLSIMVGGDKDVFERMLPILKAMGSSVTLVGPIGSGQITKAINQTIIAGTYAAVAEGMGDWFSGGY